MGLFLEGPIFGGGLSTEGNFRFKIDWASLQLEGNLLFLLCFTLYLRAISKYKPPRALYRAIKRRVFCITSLEGLYLEGLIHGGAYFLEFYTTLTWFINFRQTNFKDFSRIFQGRIFTVFKD